MPVSPERLQAVPLFSTLSAEELAALARRFEEPQVRAGTRLTTEGASGYASFVIESGAVAARIGDTMAERTVLAPRADQAHLGT